MDCTFRRLSVTSRGGLTHSHGLPLPRCAASTRAGLSSGDNSASKGRGIRPSSGGTFSPLLGAGRPIPTGDGPTSGPAPPGSPSISCCRSSLDVGDNNFGVTQSCQCSYHVGNPAIGNNLFDDSAVLQNRAVADSFHLGFSESLF